jgi:hypothetical protein
MGFNYVTHLPECQKIEMQLLYGRYLNPFSLNPTVFIESRKKLSEGFRSPPSVQLTTVAPFK